MNHWHHIIPLHAGGTDDPSNLEIITIEVHAERHRILYEQHGRYQDKDAWQALSGIIKRQDIILESQRRGGRKGAQSGEHMKKIAVLGGKAKKGILHTPEAKKKMSEAKMGPKNNFFGKKHSEATKEKQRETWKKKK